jgi:hypothetical protein
VLGGTPNEGESRVNHHLQKATKEDFEDKAEEALQELISDLDSRSSTLDISLEDYANVLVGLVDSLRERAECVQQEADELVEDP